MDLSRKLLIGVLIVHIIFCVLLLVGTMIREDTYESVLKQHLQNENIQDDDDDQDDDDEQDTQDTQDGVGGSAVAGNVATGVALQMSVNLADWAASKLGPKSTHEWLRPQI